MKFDVNNTTWKTLGKWVKGIIMVLSVPALGICTLLLVLSSQLSYSYEHPKNSPSRIVQQIDCPSLMVIDKSRFVTAVIHENKPNTEVNLTVTIASKNFFIENETTTNYKNISDNEWLTPLWWIAPKETGKQTIAVSVNTDDGLSDTATCQVTVLYFGGLELGTIFRSCTVIVAAGIIFGIQSIRKIQKEKQVPQQTAG